MYGVIDIGSNTIRLMIYKIEDTEIKPMLNKKYAAGLAGYINKDRCLSDKGIEMTVDILYEFKQITDNIGIDNVYPFATASFRNIDNSDVVLNEIYHKCGLNVRILSGKEEAVFDYYGAIQSIDVSNGLLIDIGGGSTELVMFADKKMLVTDSLPIGSLNMYNKYVADIVPTLKETQKIKKEVLSQLNTIEFPTAPSPLEAICGVGGTARSILKLFNYDRSKKEKTSSFESNYFNQLLKMLEKEKDHKKLTSGILKIAPERIHTLIPGMVILQTISEYFNITPIVVSPYGVREGYLYHILEEKGVFHE